MCLRMMPSNWAGRAAIAPRERSLRASVFSSTRTQPSVSKACVSISSFVSTLMPLRQTDGLNQVQPISTTRSAGADVQVAAAADQRRRRAGSRTAKTPSRPSPRGRQREVSNQPSKYSRLSLRCASQAQISGACAAAQRPSACSSLERLERHPLAAQRHRQRGREPAHSPIALITTRLRRQPSNSQ